jgi:hypothetical protein
MLGETTDFVWNVLCLFLLEGWKMTGLFEELSCSFSLEEVEPYGRVLVVPAKVFRQEWHSQLEREGIKVYSGAYNSQACFFLKANNEACVSEPIQESLRTSTFQHWTREEEEALIKLKSEGLSYAEIAKRLGKSKGACFSKWQRLMSTQQPTPTPALIQPTNSVELPAQNVKDAVQELIEALSMLYPNYKRVCLFLLKHAGEVMNSEA